MISSLIKKVFPTVLKVSVRNERSICISAFKFSEISPKEHDMVETGPHAVTSVLRLTRQQRDQRGIIILEGKRLINDAIQSKIPILKLFFDNPSLMNNMNLSDLPEENRIKVKATELKKWSELTTAPGLLGVFKKPNLNDYRGIIKLPVTIICDNIREPGNMGSILRTAAAVGCQRVMLTKGCVDVWDRKVLRSACGAHFRTRILNKMDWPTIKALVDPNSTVYLADCASELGTNRSRISTKYAFTNYSNADLTPEANVLILGGETESISHEADQYMIEQGGKRLHIPMENGVDSLNAGAALAVLLFEFRRKLCIV